MSYTAARVRYNLERLTSPPRAARAASSIIKCRVRGCRRLVALNNSGFVLPVCLAHHEALPRPIRVAIEAVADHSPFDPKAVLAAALVVTKVQKHFGLAPRKAKRKP